MYILRKFGPKNSFFQNNLFQTKKFDKTKNRKTLYKYCAYFFKILFLYLQFYRVIALEILQLGQKKVHVDTLY